jgi:hypothetical protein
MTNVSVLKSIPDFLGQPAGIAAIASIGIHGAIAFLLPLVSVNSTKNSPKPQASVGMVELTPSEKSRVPQPGLPSPVPLKGQLPQIPRLAPIPQGKAGELPPPGLSALSPNGLPPGLSSTALSPLPSNTPAPPADSATSLIMPPIKTDLSKLSIPAMPRTGQSVRISPRRRGEVQIDPSFIGSSRTRTPGFTNSQPQIGRFQTPLPVDRIPEVSRTPEFQTPRTDAILQTPSPNPSDSMPFSPGAGNTVPDGTGTQMAQNLPPGASQNPDLIAPVGEAPQVNGSNVNLAANGSNLPQFSGGTAPSLPTSGLRLPASGTPGTSGVTSPGTIQTMGEIKTLEQQFKKVREQYPNFVTGKPFSLALNKPALQGKTIRGGLVIDEKGRIDFLEFLGESVSPEVNEAVKQSLREHFKENTPATSSKPTYYTFSVTPSDGNGNTQATVEKKPTPSSVIPQPSEARTEATNNQVTNNQNRPLQESTVIPLAGSPVPSATPSAKPESGEQSRINRFVPVPRATSQPFIGVTQQGNNPSAASQIPVGQRVPTEVPFTQTTKNPASESLNRANTSVSTQESTIRRLRDSQMRNNSLPTPAPETTAKPTASPEAQVSSNNQPTSSTDSSKKLIRRLREFKEQRENLNQQR